MNDTKAINLEDEKPSLIERFPDPIKNYLIYPVEDFFNRYSERISRSYAFAKIGWLSYDFESLYIFELISFKLKRVESCLKNGHAIQEDEDMLALKEAIEICDRLFDEEYDSKYRELHTKKWGEQPDFTTEPTETPQYSRIVFKDRPNVKSEEDKKLEREEFLKTFENAEQDRRNDLDRLNYLFKEHLPKWWD